CGDVLRKEAIGGMFIFFDNVVKKIRNAPYGGSVDVETYRWLSFSEYVLDEWAKRPDITLNLKFREKGYLGGNIIKVTIPAGANISALKDENGYCGFANLVKNFGISQ
nr:hypothetical protein [Lachnospiraceae bacterium]